LCWRVEKVRWLLLELILIYEATLKKRLLAVSPRTHLLLLKDQVGVLGAWVDPVAHRLLLLVQHLSLEGLLLLLDLLLKSELFVRGGSLRTLRSHTRVTLATVRSVFILCH